MVRSRTQKRPLESVVLTPIGVLHTPFSERAQAPRQPQTASGARGTIELFPTDGIEHALLDLDSWSHVWVLFFFHLNESWRPKVLPPRGSRRRGVLSTRSPYRPNPIGLSVLELEKIEGLLLHVRNVDMLDGSPVLDIKPYVPYTDAVSAADSGWLEDETDRCAIEPIGPRPDPRPAYAVSFEQTAREQCDFLASGFDLDLASPIANALALGPQPHAYRRIRAVRGGLRLAFKDWRAIFRVSGREISVISLGTGYRPRELEASTEPALEPHRAFVARFGWTEASRTVHPDR
jgi:tRNA (adenine37-N6)-methyltransferase